MATISSGSVTVTIQPGEQYRVIATGEAYVDVGGGSTQSYRLINGSSERLLGGFIIATPVTIRVVSGSVDYINVSGTGDSVALSLAQSSRTDINGMVASTESGDLVMPDGTDSLLQLMSKRQSRKDNIQTKSFSAFPVQISSHGVNRNTHVQFTTEEHFDEVRVLLNNAQTVQQTGIVVSLGASQSPITSLAEMNAFTPSAFTNVTWGGSGTLTQNAGTNTRNVNWVASDWVKLSSIQPSVNSFPFLHLRIYQPSTNASITAYGATPNIAWMASSSDGRTVNAWFKDTTDATTGMPAWSSGASVAPRMIPFIVQYKARGKIVTLGVVGDSLAFGQGGVDYGRGYTYRVRNAISQSKYKVEFFNLGMPGATTTEYLNNLKSLVALGVNPHYAIYHAGSPNDISTTISAANINTMRSNLGEGISLLLSNNTAVWVSTWMPSNTAAKNYGATDSLRVAYNSEVLNYQGVTLLDISKSVSGQTVGGQVQINSSMANADNLHINDAGWDAITADNISNFKFIS